MAEADNPMEKSPYLSRKFLLATVFTLAGVGLAFAGKLSGEYVALATLVIGAYAAGNVAAKRVAPGSGE